MLFNHPFERQMLNIQHDYNLIPIQRLLIVTSLAHCDATKKLSHA